MTMNNKTVFFFQGFWERNIPLPPKFKISPPNNNKLGLFFGCFSHFPSPQKQFPRLNYIYRKNPATKSGRNVSILHPASSQFLEMSHSIGTLIHVDDSTGRLGNVLAVSQLLVKPFHY